LLLMCGLWELTCQGGPGNFLKSREFPKSIAIRISAARAVGKNRRVCN